jgi:large subunit ribosomal protein L25
MAKDIFTIAAQSRSDIGKGASRRLRHADSIPAVVYGSKKAPVSISAGHKDFWRALENEAFFSHILTLNCDKESEKVVLKDVQRHPYKPRILHIDFLRISENEKLAMNIPLHFTGGDVAPGVKQSGGLVSHLMTEVSVRCFPKDLPEYIVIDLSKLEINQAVHLSDIALPKGVEIVDLIHGENKPVATVYIPRAIVEAEKPTAVVAEAAAGEAGAPAAEGGKEKEGAKESSKK